MKMLNVLCWACRHSEGRPFSAFVCAYDWETIWFAHIILCSSLFPIALAVDYIGRHAIENELYESINETWCGARSQINAKFILVFLFVFSLACFVWFHSNSMLHWSLVGSVRWLRFFVVFSIAYSRSDRNNLYNVHVLLSQKPRQRE